MHYRFAPACIPSPDESTHVTGYAIAIDRDDGTRELMQRRSRGAWVVAIWGDEEVAQHVATNLPLQPGKLNVVPIAMPNGETADVLG